MVLFFSFSDVLDEKVLPVIISLRNGGLHKDVLVSASSLLLPIIRFKVPNYFYNMLFVQGIFQSETMLYEIVQNWPLMVSISDNKKIATVLVSKIPFVSMMSKDITF